MIRSISSLTGAGALSPALMPAPRNHWWVVAGRAELGRELLARRVLGERVALYRTEAGEAVAMQDVCPHRNLPLSQGRVVGDDVQCGYHGIAFGPDGACTGIPNQADIPDRMRVRTYPLVERWHWVWIWMGDPQAADQALIPDPGLDRPGYYDRFYLCRPIAANYMLLHENLLDTSHVSFLHAGLFDLDDEIAKSAFSVDKSNDVVRLTRRIPGFRVSEAHARLLDVPAGTPLDRTLITETYPPCLNVITTRYEDPARPGWLYERIASLPVTSAGPGLCYHFAAFTSSTAADSEQSVALLRAVIDEDAVALEAIQALACELPREVQTGVSVRADLAGLRLRRMVAAMLAAEGVQISTADGS